MKKIIGIAALVIVSTIFFFNSCEHGHWKRTMAEKEVCTVTDDCFDCAMDYYDYSMKKIEQRNKVREEIYKLEMIRLDKEIAVMDSIKNSKKKVNK